VVPTNDLWKSIEFFQDVFGGKLNRLVNVNLRGLAREVPEMAFVKVANHPGWGVAMQPQPIPPPIRPMEGPTWGFEVDERGLEGVRKILDDKKVPCEGPFFYPAPSPIAATLLVRDHHDFEYEFTERRDDAKSDQPAFGDLGLRRISHVRLEVTDLDAAEAWYTDTLKLVPANQVPGEAQITLKTRDSGQLFILREVEEMTQRSWYAFGPHVDVKVPIGELEIFISRLENIERYWSPFPEKIPWHEPNMNTVYFYDPFGNRLQVSEDIPHP
jgi:catechol 2,3-dioxygenase-like lactoylglutathione lyase family enzyme